MNPAALVEMVVVVGAAGVALAAIIWALRRVGAVLDARRRARYERARPLVEVALGVVAVLAVTALLLEDRPTVLTGVVLALFALLVGAGWFAIRDLVSGAVVRAEDSYEPGQWIRVDGGDGRIRDVGTRTLEIEQEDGTRVRIPYARIARAPVVRAGRAEDPAGHTFSIELPPELSPVRVLPVIRSAARNCFFVSATRSPQVHVTSGPLGHRYDITVFTLDRTFLPEVEAEVRTRVEAMG